MQTYEIMPAIFQRFIWVPLRVSMSIFCSLKVEGVEHVKNIRGNMIIASNHSSELDPLLIVACLPFFSRHLPLFFTSREKDFYASMGWKRIIYGGTFFRMMGAYQAYVGLKNYELALRHHLKFINEGKNICIFPSGKRNLRGEKPTAKGGVGFLARETQLPIMPILIQGLENLTLADFFSGKRKVTVTFGKPLYAKDIFQNAAKVVIDTGRNDYEKAAAVLMEKIAQLA